MKKATIILRASVMLAAVSALVVGVTYASLQSTATLTDNTISSATAELLVDGPDGDSTATASEGGFTFSGLLPGADYSTAQQFSLKNNGSAGLRVTVYATVGSLSGVLDKTKVHVKFTNTTTASSAEYTLAQLESLFNDVPGVSDPNNLAAGVSDNFDIQVKMDADAISGGSATLSGFNFVFTGSSFVAGP